MVTASKGKVLRRARPAAFALTLLGSGLCRTLCGGSLAADPGEGPEAGAGPGPKEDGKAAAAPKKKAGSRRELEWLDLATGLSRVREKYLPAIVLFEGRTTSVSGEGDGAAEREGAAEGNGAGGDGAVREDRAPGKGLLDDHLADVTSKEVFRRFILIRVEAADLAKPYPVRAVPKPPRGKAEPPGPEGEKPAGGNGAPKEGAKDAGVEDAAAAETAAVKLGLEEAKPSVVILNLREEVSRRHDGSLPPPSKLRKELGGVWKLNEIHAREARKVEPQIESSRYAFRLGRVREAVQKVLPFDEKHSRKFMDPVLDKRMSDLIAEYRAKAKEALAAADQLDAEKKHEAAIKAFDEVAKNFPFPEVLRQANRRKSEILRKLTFP